MTENLSVVLAQVPDQQIHDVLRHGVIHGRARHRLAGAADPRPRGRRRAAPPAAQRRHHVGRPHFDPLRLRRRAVLPHPASFAHQSAVCPLINNKTVKLKKLFKKA